MTLISDSFEMIDMVTERLEDKKGTLGLGFVGSYGEKRVPRFPAAVVVPGPRSKELHSIGGRFAVVVQLSIYVYHSKLTETYRERSREDLKLVSRIETELESYYEWPSDLNNPATKRVIFAYVSDEDPGAVMPRTEKNREVVVCTKLTWRALTQRNM